MLYVDSFSDLNGDIFDIIKYFNRKYFEDVDSECSFVIGEYDFVYDDDVVGIFRVFFIGMFCGVKNIFI